MRNSAAWGRAARHDRPGRCRMARVRSACQSRVQAHLHTRVALATQLPHQQLVELGVEHAIGHGLRIGGGKAGPGSAAAAARSPGRAGCGVACCTAATLR